MIVAALALAGIFISLYLTLYKLGVIGELSCSTRLVRDSQHQQMVGFPWPARRCVGAVVLSRCLRRGAAGHDAAVGE